MTKRPHRCSPSDKFILFKYFLSKWLNRPDEKSAETFSFPKPVFAEDGCWHAGPGCLKNQPAT